MKGIFQKLMPFCVRIIPLGLYQCHMVKGKYGHPDIDDGFAIVIRRRAGSRTQGRKLRKL